MQKAEDKLANWKEKAKARRKENAYLRRRVSTLRMSRDRWKAKHKSVKQSSSVASSCSCCLPSSAERACPRGHLYPVFLIVLCLSLRQQSSASYRSICKILVQFNLQFSLSLPLPCANSIRNWEHKLGYYQLSEPDFGTEKYVLIVDESMSIGGESILLILGVDLSKYTYSRALNFTDVKVLSMSLKPSWKGEQIQQEIETLQQAGLQISYVVSDGGRNLCKCFANLELIRVEDCTHALGKLLEKRYKDDPLFDSFAKAATRFKQQVCMGTYSAFRPPTQRRKGRFLNLLPLTKWAIKTLSYLDQGQLEHLPELRTKLDWLLSYRTLIEEIAPSVALVNEVFAILKNQGLTPHSAKQCRELITKTKAQSPTSITEGIDTYLRTNLDKLPDQQRILCCSDIIESYFGRFKKQLKQATNTHMTRACLSIPNYATTIEEKIVKQAMENVAVRTLDKWQETYCKQHQKKQIKNLMNTAA